MSGVSLHPCGDSAAGRSRAGQKGARGLGMSNPKRVRDRLHLDPNMRGILRECQRELIVHFPVRMQDGVVKVFAGNPYAVVESGLRWMFWVPGLSRVIYYPTEVQELVIALRNADGSIATDAAGRAEPAGGFVTIPGKPVVWSGVTPEPEPVGPVTKIKPRGLSASFAMTWSGGAPSGLPMPRSTTSSPRARAAAFIALTSAKT